MVGARDAIARARTHPLARAVRIDKLSLAALEATLRLYRDGAVERVPVLRMLNASDDELRARAERMAARIPAAAVGTGTARVGGGALPLLELEGPVCAVEAEAIDELARKLRLATPSVVARVRDGRLELDPRTLTDAEADAAADAVAEALR